MRYRRRRYRTKNTAKAIRSATSNNQVLAIPAPSELPTPDFAIVVETTTGTSVVELVVEVVLVVVDTLVVVLFTTFVAT